MTDTIAAKRARLIGQLAAAQTDRGQAVDPALRLSRLLQIEELLQELFADDPDREEQYRALLLATCSLIEQIRAAYPDLGEVETPAATSESRLTCEPDDADVIEVHSLASPTPIDRYRAVEPLPAPSDAVACEFDCGRVVRRPADAPADKPIICKRCFVNRDRSRWPRHKVTLASVDVPEPADALLSRASEVQLASLSDDEAIRRQLAATEKRMRAKGYLQLPDGTWCKPPAWDPLGLAMPLWDELPDVPPPPAPAPKTSAPSWINEPRNYAMSGLLVAAAFSVALLPGVDLHDLPSFVFVAVLAWAAMGLWDTSTSSSRPISPKTSPKPYRGRCSECRRRDQPLHPFSGWCEECWTVKPETPRVCQRCGFAVESGISGSICSSCTSPRRTVHQRCQRCYGSFPVGSVCETCIRPRCVRCSSVIEPAMTGSVCVGCWVDLER